MILREACKFDDEFSRGDNTDAGVKDNTHMQTEKDKFKSESAKKILSAMESKFLDFFVEDDLVENLFLHDDSEKGKIGTKRHEIENAIKEQIADKITTLQKTTDNPPENLKTNLKKIFQSTIIENSIMTQDFIDDSKPKNLSTSSNSDNINLIDNIDKIFALNAIDSTTQEITETNLHLTDKKNGFCKIDETFAQIHANIATITAIGCGLINLTGKIINKSLSDLTRGLKSEGGKSAEAPSGSVHGEKISAILRSLPLTLTTQDYV